MLDHGLVSQSETGKMKEITKHSNDLYIFLEEDMSICTVATHFLT